MNILDDIAGQRGLRTCIALTFNFDIAWFEALVYQRLLTAGVQRILIITDLSELSAAIERQSGSIYRAGIDYSVIGIKVPGCFHPKAIFLSGQDTAKLYVGSGNITSGGFGRNLEVFECFDAAKGDRKVSPVFEQFRTYLEGLLLNQFEVVPSSVTSIMTHGFGTDVLALPHNSDEKIQLLGSPNELLGRLEFPEPPADSLVMVSPYFDAKGEMVLKFAERFKAVRFRVITDKRRTNLCTKAATAIIAAGGDIQFLEIENQRPLHAKILWGKGQNWSLGVSGSANLSNAAWYGHNAELIAVRQGKLADELESLIDSLVVKDATESELAELGNYRPGEDEFEKNESSLIPDVITAKWIGRDQIELYIDRPLSVHDFTVEFLGLNGPEIAKKVSQSSNDVRLIVIPFSLMKRGRSAMGRICADGVPGPWFVVEDSRKLAEHAQSGRSLDEHVKNLLHGSEHEYSPEKLLNYLSTVFKNRNERFKKRMDIKAEDVNEEIDKKPNHIEWAWVNEGDFEVHDSLSSNDVSHYQSTGGRLRLIKLLLFGSENPLNDDSNEGESELDEINSDIRKSSKIEEGKGKRNPKKSKNKRLPEVVSKACDLYLKQLESGDCENYPLGRIVEDMQVLCAAIHSVFESGYISEINYRNEIYRVLFAFIGSSHAQFLRALSQVPGEKSLEEWEETPLLLLVGVLLYNFCLSYSEGKKIQVVEAILWFRHVLPLVPREHVDQVMNDIDRQIPMLKNGVYWLQNSLGAQIELNPFQNFFRDMVGNTYSILELEKSLPSIAFEKINKNDLDSVHPRR